MQWIPPAPPPPQPPSVAPAPQPLPPCGWRWPKGQEYWERTLDSFHALLPHRQVQQSLPGHQPPPATATTGPEVLHNNNLSVSNDIHTSHSMDTTSNIKLSTAYYQTRNTRRAHNSTTIHNIDNSTTHETSTPHIGSFNIDTSINNTFLASQH